MNTTVNQDLVTSFVQPSSMYRGKPFWAWNGKLEKAELIRQIHIMKKMGFGGFFIHSRTGLETEYLGGEWFEFIDACIEEASKLDMEVWLYDEDRWPSGTAGGLVTINPEYRMKYLRMAQVLLGEFKWDKTTVAAFACDIDGLNLSSYEFIPRDADINQFADRALLVFTIEEMAKQNFYNGYTYLDTLNRNATDKFIEVTHEKYKAECGVHFGKSIKGIFTDEPHRGLLMCRDGHNNEDLKNLVPWTYKLFDEFKARFGYDLVSRLPELFLRKDSRRISQVKWHYVELLQQLFIENWAQPILSWCRKHNLILTGHGLHEDSLTAQTVPQGSIMRYYEYLEYPGVDVLTEHNTCYWIVKQLASVARQMGHKFMLSELYGCSGWQMSFENHKMVGDWQALFGINLRCHHLFWYTMQGQAKRDYPASISHHSPWFDQYSIVEDYFSRIHVFMHQGDPECEILVINPVESVWAQIYPGWARWISSTSEDIDKLELKYSQLFSWLCRNHYDFDYGDEDHIFRFANVEIDEGKPVLRLGHCRYTTVIVSGMETIRSSTIAILEKFITAGGQVVFAGDVPTYVDAIECQTCCNVSKHATRVPFEEIELISQLESIIQKPLCADCSDIYIQTRKNGETRHIFALNINRKHAYSNVRIQIKGGGNVQLWDPANGERFRVETRILDGCVEFEIDFAPGQSFLFLQTNEHHILPLAVTQKTGCDWIQSEPIFDYSLSEPNICVLDSARYIFKGKEYEKKEILKIDRYVRSALGLDFRTGEMLQPWYVKKYGHQGLPNCAELELIFDFQIETLPSDDIELVIENPEQFEIRINDKVIPAKQSDKYWIDPCFRIFAIPKTHLVNGTNSISLRTLFEFSTNLEAIYLRGAFGVSVESDCSIIGSLPNQLAIGDITDQRLAFYSGTVNYYLDLSKYALKGKKLLLQVELFKGAYLKIRTSKGFKVLAWQPYQLDITDLIDDSQVITLELVLTRRNTFGPLHQKPVNADAYGPDSFISEGANFTDDYLLYPAGLLTAPRLTLI